MAKARTVRTFPSTSSATPVALATCAERDEGHGRGQPAGQGGPGLCPWGVAGEGRGVYLLLRPAGEAAEEGADEGAGAHQRGHDEEEEAGELGREQVQREDAARRLGAAAQALRRTGPWQGRAPGWGSRGVRCHGLTWEMMSLKEDLNSWTSAVSRFTSCPVRLAS